MITWQVESLSVSRQSNDLLLNKGYINEDRWVAREMVSGRRNCLLAGVIDGAAPLVSSRGLPLGETAGSLVSEIIKESIMSADSNQSLKSMLLDANRRIRHASLYYGVDYARPETMWAAAASLVRLNSAGNLEYAHIADTTILVAGTERGDVLTRNQVYSFDCNIFWAMYEARRRGILDPDGQVAFARTEMIAQKALANAPKGAGYGAINGMEENRIEEYIEEGSIKMNNEVRFVALLTDGMLPPPTKIGESPDWQHIVSILRWNGLEGLFFHTRQIEESDPWLKLPRVKNHDDATGVLIHLHGNTSVPVMPLMTR